MCPPTYFRVDYEINDWMHQNDPVDIAKARVQWESVRDIYLKLGHSVLFIEPHEAVPDLIFTANAGLILDGKVLLSNFKYEERQPETAINREWFENHSYSKVKVTENVWEGEGDCLVANGWIFAGYGFRSDKASHTEVAKFFDREVISLKLVDPRFYHLDTCFCPLDARTIMYFPSAFDDASRKKIKDSGLMLIEAEESEAAAFGLNAVSDGHNVIMSSQAPALAGDLRKRGYNPIMVDISEFKKSGGGVKCITLELRT